MKKSDIIFDKDVEAEEANRPEAEVVEATIFQVVTSGFKARRGDNFNWNRKTDTIGGIEYTRLSVT